MSALSATTTLLLLLLELILPLEFKINSFLVRVVTLNGGSDVVLRDVGLVEVASDHRCQFVHDLLVLDRISDGHQ